MNWWDRARSTHGWRLYGAIWLVFLIFPIMAALDAESQWRTISGIALILVFAAVFMSGFREKCYHNRRTAGMVVGVMLAVAAIVAATIGWGALGLLPFVLTYAIFMLPLRWSLPMCVTGLLVTAVLPWTVGPHAPSDFLPFTIILFALLAGSVILSELIRHEGYRSELEQQLAIVEERDRVARDVHDILGHGLTVIAVKAELAKRLIRTDPERAEKELDDLHALARVNLSEVRATVTGLRTMNLGSELAAARHALQAAGVAAHIPSSADAVRDDVRPLFAWVVREAATNVIRHSRARTCDIELGENWITVRDNGKGMNGSTEANGLRGLRERVAAAQGSVSMTPAAQSSGTCVHVEVP